MDLLFVIFWHRNSLTESFTVHQSKRSHSSTAIGCQDIINVKNIQILIWPQVLRIQWDQERAFRYWEENLILLKNFARSSILRLDRLAIHTTEQILASMHIKKKPLCFPIKLKMLPITWFNVINISCVHLMYQALFYGLCGNREGLCILGAHASRRHIDKWDWMK